MRGLRVGGLVLAGLLAGPGCFAADIVLEVKSPGSTGRVIAALYDSAANFLRKPVATSSGELAAGVVALRFLNLPPGRYAISAYLDSNGNNRLDTSSMGIPVEPYAFTRGAKGRMGPPSFDDAAVDFPAAGATFTLELRK